MKIINYNNNKIKIIYVHMNFHVLNNNNYLITKIFQMQIIDIYVKY